MARLPHWRRVFDMTAVPLGLSALEQITCPPQLAFSHDSSFLYGTQCIVTSFLHKVTNGPFHASDY